MTINDRVLHGDRAIEQIGNLVVGSNFVLCRHHHVLYLAAGLPPAAIRTAVGVALSWYRQAVN